MNAQLRLCDGIIRHVDGQLSESQQIIQLKDNIITADTIAYKKLAKDYGKEQGKVGRLKQTSLILLITTSLLGLILILK